MRSFLVAVTVLAVVSVSEAGEPQRFPGGPRADLFINAPLEYDTSVVFPFGGSHHAVPGVVSINRKAPYFCRVHALGFPERTSFVEHLGVKHGLSDRDIPGMVLVDRHQVRYVGD